MYVLHEKEQFFFDQPTLDQLTGFLSAWKSPCCICAPLLGKSLVEAGVDVTILDIDERFSSLKGFRRFDINRPDWLGDEIDIIVCDSLFYNVSLSNLFAAHRTLVKMIFLNR